LRVAYLTAWPLPDGTVAFRDDIYQLDQTGFTVGQPLPPGELSEEGLRYVLKPIPRQLSQVDAAEAEGIGIFGNRKTTRVTPLIPRRAKPIAGEDQTGDEKVSDLGIFGKKKPASGASIIKSNQPVVAEKKTPFFTTEDKPESGVKTGKKFTLFGAASKASKNAETKTTKPLFKSNFASAKKERGKPFSFFNSKKVAKAEPETSGPSNIANLAPATTARKPKFKKIKVTAQKPAGLQCTILNGVAQPGCKGVKKVKTVRIKSKLRAKPAAASLR
jgi:hypothetical protein